MSMGSRKVNTEGIDEELLLASIGRRTQDGDTAPPHRKYPQLHRPKRTPPHRNHLLCNP